MDPEYSRGLARDNRTDSERHPGDGYDLPLLLHNEGYTTRWWFRHADSRQCFAALWRDLGHEVTLEEREADRA